MREDENIAKSVENLERNMHGSHLGAIRRIRSDISKAIPAASREDGSKKNCYLKFFFSNSISRKYIKLDRDFQFFLAFGAIFRNRLKDQPFLGNGCTVTFKCAIVGNPQPTVEWFFNENLVVNDHKHKVCIFYSNLVIL